MNRVKRFNEIFRFCDDVREKKTTLTPCRCSIVDYGNKHGVHVVVDYADSVCRRSQRDGKCFTCELSIGILLTVMRI